MQQTCLESRVQMCSKDQPFFFRRIASSDEQYITEADPSGGQIEDRAGV